MAEITCPKCGTTFQVDDSTYAAIIDQVRNDVFNQEVERRIEELKKLLKAEQHADELAAAKEASERLAEKDSTIAELRQLVEKLQGAIAGYDAQKKAEVAELTSNQTKALADLESEKDKEIAALRTQIAQADAQHQLDIEQERNSCKDELHQKEQALTLLQSQLENEQTAAQKRELEIRENNAVLLREKQEEIDRLKDFKARLSTKMLGETLEQHCATSFAQMQSMGMFPGAYFSKDNDSQTSGTKGDFIFRDFMDNQEYISVMFEMKNEADTTATKHRNTDFLEKLDKDRRDKGCEYAVLVTMLEQDNPLYDNGIVDMSHLYPKMLVIRPQFFIPLLRVLTEASKNNLTQIMSLRDELSIAKEQSLDVTKLWEKIQKFSGAFSKNLVGAKQKYDSAMTGIDAVITALEKQIAALRTVKANFDASEQKLLKANEVLEEDFTIKKLTYGNPAMREKLEEADETYRNQNLLDN